VGLECGCVESSRLLSLSGYAMCHVTFFAIAIMVRHCRRDDRAINVTVILVFRCRHNLVK
jgi:hypothetical protein